MYRSNEWRIIVTSISLIGSSVRTIDSGRADFDRPRVHRRGRLAALVFASAASSSTTALTVTVLKRLFGGAGKSTAEREPRLEAAVFSRFEVEVFVRGFVNLVGALVALRGASADCVLPILIWLSLRRHPVDQPLLRRRERLSTGQLVQGMMESQRNLFQAGVRRFVKGSEAFAFTMVLFKINKRPRSFQPLLPLNINDLRASQSLDLPSF